MSDPEEEVAPPKPYSAFVYDAQADPGTLSLSDSDPSLSDDAEVASLTPEEEEVEEELCRDGEQKPPVLPFMLKGANAGFSQRSTDIFGGLKELETMFSPSQSRNRGKRQKSLSSVKECPLETYSPPNVSKQSDSSSTSHSPTAEETATVSVSADVAEVPQAASRLPDYLTHPERWTKYSLEEVPETSDSSNRSAALRFLAELQQQKEDKESTSDSSSRSYNQGASSSNEGRILFSKPLKECKGTTEKRGAQQGLILIAEDLGDEGQEEGKPLQVQTESVGFHGVKKRSRKNIRLKADSCSEDDS
ncbi:protein TSSC4 [Bombina bombina]|uniref:protein TSSC4 n=1 Tax=Bombina bombina TaxID=8345 RepID=UPI00235A52CD|nr:protein TSSC4 [Bombina bombina]